MRASLRPDQTHRFHPMSPAACPALPRRTLLCMGAITGLSCTAICRGCPRQYQMRQVSPCTPTPLLTSQQPTCVAKVRPSRAALSWDFHPFGIYRVALVAQSPVSVSPNINPFFDAGSDRKRESHPLAPLVCRASAITRTRLQAMPSCVLRRLRPAFLPVTNWVAPSPV